MDVDHNCQTYLNQIAILPRRLLLHTPDVYATVPILRGVWGAALHDLAPDVYAAVFEPSNSVVMAPAYEP